MTAMPDDAAPVSSNPAGPSTSSSAAGAGFSVLGAVAAVAVCMPLALLALFAPKFAVLFADFGVALPGASVLSIRTGVALSSPVGIAILLLLAMVTLFTIAFAFRWNRVLGLILFGLCCLWFCLSMGIAVVSLMLPLVAMIESLQKGGAV